MQPRLPGKFELLICCSTDYISNNTLNMCTREDNAVLFLVMTNFIESLEEWVCSPISQSEAVIRSSLFTLFSASFDSSSQFDQRVECFVLSLTAFQQLSIPSHRLQAVAFYLLTTRNASKEECHPGVWLTCTWSKNSSSKSHQQSHLQRSPSGSPLDTSSSFPVTARDGPHHRR